MHQLLFEKSMASFLCLHNISCVNLNLYKSEQFMFSLGLVVHIFYHSFTGNNLSGKEDKVTYIVHRVVYIYVCVSIICSFKVLIFFFKYTGVFLVMLLLVHIWFRACWGEAFKLQLILFFPLKLVCIGCASWSWPFCPK